MMKQLSLKLKQDTYNDAELVAAQLKINVNEYITNAINSYNHLQKRNLISDKLAKESKMVQKESLKVLAEFEKMTDK